MNDQTKVVPNTQLKDEASQASFGQEVTRLVGEIRKPCSMAWRDSLVEQLIELIDPSPAATLSPLCGGAPVNSVALNIEAQLRAVVRERDGWKEESEHQKALYEAACRSVEMLRDHERKHFWIWQGDGSDNLVSMSRSMTILIRADQLCSALAAQSQGAQEPIGYIGEDAAGMLKAGRGVTVSVTVRSTGPWHVPIYFAAQQAAAPGARVEELEAAIEVAMNRETVLEDRIHELEHMLDGSSLSAPGTSEALDDNELTRLRRVVRALGMENEVPQDDATLRGCLFSVLGMIARKLEDKARSRDWIAGHTEWINAPDGDKMSTAEAFKAGMAYAPVASSEQRA
jgi:hypothetical protein